MSLQDKFVMFSIHVFNVFLLQFLFNYIYVPVQVILSKEFTRGKTKIKMLQDS